MPVRRTAHLPRSVPSPSGSINEARIAVTALRELGYGASLRLLPVSTYFTYTADSRNRAQVVDGGFQRRLRLRQ